MNIKKRGELIKLIDHYNLPRAAAEIGVAQGLFSKELLDSGFDVLYLIDIWENVPFIQGCASFEQDWHNRNYLQVQSSLEKEIKEKKAIILKGFSHKMAEFINDQSLGLVYLDGAHDYHSVKSDIQSWWPKLVPGGVLAFHDYANSDYGVSRAAIEFMKGEQFVNVIEEDGSIENIGAWIRK